MIYMLFKRVKAVFGHEVKAGLYGKTSLRFKVSETEKYFRNIKDDAEILHLIFNH